MIIDLWICCAHSLYHVRQVRWLTDVTAEKPQKELALNEAGLFLAEKMTNGFTLICPTGDKSDPTTEASSTVKMSKFGKQHS